MPLKDTLLKARWPFTVRSVVRSRIFRALVASIGVGCEFYRDVNYGSESYLFSIADRVRPTTGVKLCTLAEDGCYVINTMTAIGLIPSDEFVLETTFTSISMWCLCPA